MDGGNFVFLLLKHIEDALLSSTVRTKIPHGKLNNKLCPDLHVRMFARKLLAG